MPRAPHSSALLAGRPRAKRRGVLQELLGGAVDALQQAERLAVDVRHRQEALPAWPATRTLPQPRNRAWRAAGGSDALQGGGEPVQAGQDVLFVTHCRRGSHGQEIRGGRLIRPRFYRRRGPRRHRLPNLLQTGAMPLYSASKSRERGRGPKPLSSALVASRPSPRNQSHVHLPCFCPRPWRRERFHASAGADPADVRDLLFPAAAAAAAARQGAPRDGRQHPPRRYGRHLAAASSARSPR